MVITTMGKSKKISIQDYELHRHIKKHNAKHPIDILPFNTKKLEKYYNHLSNEVYKVHNMSGKIHYVLSDSISRHKLNLTIPCNVLVEENIDNCVITGDSVIYINMYPVIIDLLDPVQYYITIGYRSSEKKYYKICFNIDNIITHVSLINTEKIITLFGPKVLDELLKLTEFTITE